MKFYDVDLNIILFSLDWWILLDIKSFHSKGITRIHKGMRSIKREREREREREISYPLIIFVWWTMFAICYSSLLRFFCMYNFSGDSRNFVQGVPISLWKIFESFRSISGRFSKYWLKFKIWLAWSLCFKKKKKCS